MYSSKLKFCFLICLLFIGGLLLVSCKQEGEKQVKGKNKKIAHSADSKDNTNLKEDLEENSNYDRYWNDLARFIAGKEPLPGSVLDSIDYSKEAGEHRAFYKSQMDIEVSERLKKLENWAKNELGAERETQQNVLYPFSGADFLHISTLFPNAKSYTLYGLEPEGNIPDIRGLDKQKIVNNLRNIQSILTKNFNLSFFRTSDMGREFNATELSGTTPILMLFMSLKGYEILDVKRIYVNKKSELVYLYSDVIPKQTVKDSAITGVEIKFRKEGNQSVQALRYFNYDAQDIYLKNQNYLLNYFSKVKPAKAYFKSASYLMHWNTYSIIRNNILDASDMIIQDDTGIAYRFYDKNQWQFSLYGKYIPPIAEFKGQYQKDLAAAFTGSNVKPLDFGLGYHNDLGTSNLIIAKRKK